MQASHAFEVTLSYEEREVVVELLDRERTNLPVEIHHTRTSKFRDVLKQRLAIVESLFKRLTDA